MAGAPRTTPSIGMASPERIIRRSLGLMSSIATGFDPVAAAALCRARNPTEQRFHFPLRRASRVTLERLAASEHHGDHDSTKLLAAGERAAHRQSGDEI